jgi:hypothetical protein
MNKLIKLHVRDNVFVVIVSIAAGEVLTIADKEILFQTDIKIGHKIAARAIDRGEKVIKNGFPIGSATNQIEMGRHIHLHNMKSNYIPTYTIDSEYKEQIQLQ